jgi:outer membrane protein OmpA-like peptidoglycan-associated protein
MEFVEVAITSLTPSVCSINSEGDVLLISAGTCTLRGQAPGGDDGEGVFYDEGVRRVSFAVLPENIATTLPGSELDFGGGVTRPNLPGNRPNLPGTQPVVPAPPSVISRPNPPQQVGNISLGGSGSTVGIKSPPPPAQLTTDRLPGNRRAKVTITVDQRRPDAPVRGVVLLVFDQSGVQRHRVTVDVPAGETVITARVPFRDGYQVRAVTINEAGISNRAPIGTNVLNQPTVLRQKEDGTPVLFGKRVSRPVLFGPNSPALDAQARAELRKVVKYADKNGGRVFITGFVRNQGGDPRFQKRLSADRAQQVAEYLSARGVRTWIRYDGYGAYRKGQGRPQDRRVEVRWSADEIPRLRAPRASRAPKSAGAAAAPVSTPTDQM